MRLVGQACGGGDLCGRLTPVQQPLGLCQATGHQHLLRCDTVLRPEDPQEVKGTEPGNGGQAVQREALGVVLALFWFGALNAGGAWLGWTA